MENLQASAAAIGCGHRDAVQRDVPPSGPLDWRIMFSEIS